MKGSTGRACGPMQAWLCWLDVAKRSKENGSVPIDGGQRGNQLAGQDSCPVHEGKFETSFETFPINFQSLGMFHAAGKFCRRRMQPPLAARACN